MPGNTLKLRNIVLLASSVVCMNNAQARYVHSDVASVRVHQSIKSAGALAPAAINSAENNKATNVIMLAVKFVEFADDKNTPVLSRDSANVVIAEINQIYSQCQLKLTLQDYQIVTPADVGLDYSTRSMDELDGIRAPFNTAKELVVINTGPWDHAGMGVANAWTAMPGETLSGAVIEAPVAGDAPLVAHELGHYLSLDHVADEGNIMNPIVYDTSKRIDPYQCLAMRQTAQSVLSLVIR